MCVESNRSIFTCFQFTYSIPPITFFTINILYTTFFQKVVFTICIDFTTTSKLGYTISILNIIQTLLKCIKWQWSIITSSIYTPCILILGNSTCYHIICTLLMWTIWWTCICACFDHTSSSIPMTQGTINSTIACIFYYGCSATCILYATFSICYTTIQEILTLLIFFVSIQGILTYLVNTFYPCPKTIISNRIFYTSFFYRISWT